MQTCSDDGNLTMTNVRPLPAYLVQRYHGWKATTWHENRAW